MFARLAFMFHQRDGVGEEGCCHKHNNSNYRKNLN